MKIAIGLALLGLTLTAFAGESQTITYDGSQSVTQITLRGEKTRTEYKNEETPWTCYKEGIVGYETVCTSGPFPVGLPGSFPGGLNDPRYRFPIGMYPGYGRCNRMPIYRSVPYSCTRNIRSSYQVKEYDVVANITVNVTNKSSSAANEQIKLSLVGEKIEVSSTSNKYLVSVKKGIEGSAVNGSVKTLDAAVMVELVDASSVKKALKLDSISLEDGILTVGMASVARNNIALSLNITKKKLGADKLVLERELSPSEVEMVSTRDGVEAKINVAKLGVKLANGKYAVTVKAAVKTDGALVNRASLGELEASKTLIYSIR